MSVVSHNLKEVNPYGANSNQNIYEYHLSDGSILEYSYVCSLATDVDSIALSNIPTLENDLISSEHNSAYEVGVQGGNQDTVVPVFQPQSEFDLAVLTLFMKEADVHIFHASLPFFLAVETRGGANANQRALYLGIDRVTYDQIAKRYGDDQGAAFFIEDSKNQVWE